MLSNMHFWVLQVTDSLDKQKLVWTPTPHWFGIALFSRNAVEFSGAEKWTKTKQTGVYLVLLSPLIILRVIIVLFQHKVFHQVQSVALQKHFYVLRALVFSVASNIGLGTFYCIVYILYTLYFLFVHLYSFSPQLYGSRWYLSPYDCRGYC